MQNKTIEIKPESVIDIGKAREGLDSTTPQQSPPNCKTIEDVCDYYRSIGKHEYANQVMAKYTEQMHKAMEVRVDAEKEFFIGARSWGCDCCDDRPECQLYESSESLVRDALIPLALQTLIQCENLQMRLTGGKRVVHERTKPATT